MTDDPRTEAVREAMEAVPVSRREIARRAELAHTTLNRIAQGEGRATVRVAAAVARALDALAGEVAGARDAVLAYVDRDAEDEEA